MQSATTQAPKRPLNATQLALGFFPILLISSAIQAQQPWLASPSYPDSRYIQTNPNYVPPSGGQTAYPQQDQYAQPQAYAQQSYGQPPESQQTYSDPGQSYADPGQQQAFGAQQQPPAQPFAAQQLEQLVAPIALYPDTLVAQVLAAATYPAQVSAADNWLRSQGSISTDQTANAVSSQTNWDPSVKALTAFPQVLAMMDRDLHWTTDLGNAYYNQPQDVLQTIQVLRQRAQSAGTLQNTPQEQVSNNQGYIQLAPPNPQVVYVPTYNPWAVYGQPIAPYPGFTFGDALGAIGSFIGTGLRFGAGIGLAAFNNTPFGWAGWLLNWLGSSIFFNHSPYYSHSMSVAHWGGGYGHGYRNLEGGLNRRPAGFGRPQQGYNRFGNGVGGQGFNHEPSRMPENYAYGRSTARPAMPPRPEAYGRIGGNSFYSNRSGLDLNRSVPNAVRPVAPYGGAHIERTPAYAYPRNDFAQRSYAEPRSYSAGRGNEQAFRSYESSGQRFAGQQYGGQRFSEPRSSGSHIFGGGRGGESYHASYHAPKAPKMPKMSGGGHHSGGGHSSHHGR